MELRRLGPPVALALGALCCAVDAFGCSPEHSYLAAQASSTASSASGTGGGGASMSSSSGTGAAGVGGNNEGAGPTGPSQLTILNAVNDYPSIRFCFMPYPAGDSKAKPWPEDEGGLAFADARAIDPIDSVIPSGTDVLPWAIGGNLKKTVGKTCDEIIAIGTEPFPGPVGAGGGGSGGASGLGGASSSGGGGHGGASGGGGSSASSGGSGGAPPLPPFIAVALAVLPASTITSGRSLLVAPAGCLGGPGRDDDNGELACGVGYTSIAPTVTLVAVAMSRLTTQGKLSLQVTQASIASGLLDVGFTPGTSSPTNIPISYDISVGATAPVSPFVGIATTDIGGVGSAVLTASTQTGEQASVSLAKALKQGDLGGAGFVDGGAYTFVAVGAAPGLGAGPFWHPFTFASVKNAP